MSARPASLTPDPIEAEHRERLLPWARRAVDLVMRKVEDARSHAENAVTAVLRDAPDGRPSLLALRRNRSYAAALDRLDELWAQIGGPSIASSSGFVHDAAEAFYGDSRRIWWGRIDPDFRVVNREPTRAQLAYVRSLLWYGVSVRQGFEPQFVTTKSALTAAMSVAGAQAAKPRDARIALDTWEQQANARLIPRLGLALSDANQRADLQAMKDTIRPEFQED